MLPRTGSTMFCFFQRGTAIIRCEVKTEWNRDGYELVIDRDDTMVRVERFRDARALNRRWTEFEGRLINDGWTGPLPCAE